MASGQPLYIKVLITPTILSYLPVRLQCRSIYQAFGFFRFTYVGSASARRRLKVRRRWCQTRYGVGAYTKCRAQLHVLKFRYICIEISPDFNCGTYEKSRGQNEISCPYVALYSISLLRPWALAIRLLFLCT